MHVLRHPLAAFALISLALFGNRGQFNGLALLLVLLAFGLTLAALARRFPPCPPLAVGVILFFQFAALFAQPGQMLPGLDWFWPHFQIGIALAGLVCLSYGLGATRLARWRFPMLLLIFVLIGAGVILHFPAPGIDVWIFQQQGVEHLLAGRNPYAATYPNPYGHAGFHAPEILVDGRIRSCPYPPASLLLVIPGYLAGDVRWSLLAALALTGAAAAAIGRRLGKPAGDPVELAAAALLFNPASFLLIMLAWTEPLLALSAALALLGLLGSRPTAKVIGLAGVLAAKQYGLIWLPAWRGRLSAGELLAALVVAGAATLPFFLWDPAAFWFGVVKFQFLQPFREDALSIPAAVARLTGYQLPSALGLLAALLVAGWVGWRGARELAEIPLAGAAILLALVLFNKQAFLNYYWLVQAFLIFSALLAVGVPEERGEGETEG